MEGNSSIIDRCIIELEVILIQFVPSEIDINREVLRLGKKLGNRFPDLETFKEKLKGESIVPNTAKCLDRATASLSRDPIALKPEKGRLKVLKNFPGNCDSFLIVVC